MRVSFKGEYYVITLFSPSLPPSHLSLFSVTMPLELDDYRDDVDANNKE